MVSAECEMKFLNLRLKLRMCRTGELYDNVVDMVTKGVSQSVFVAQGATDTETALNHLQET
eukprot:gene9137-2979_t